MKPSEGAEGRRTEMTEENKQTREKKKRATAGRYRETSCTATRGRPDVKCLSHFGRTGFKAAGVSIILEPFL